MQIPYDLEFVQSRPPANVRAVAMSETFPAWASRRQNEKPDGFDALLAWVHRMLRRFEKK